MIRDGLWSGALHLACGLSERLPAAGRSRTILEAVRKSLSIVPELPTWVQIETTNRCNFSCEMCPRNLLQLPDADMDRDTFEFVLSRLGLQPGSLITLFGLGEPLIHPDIFWMVRQVRERGLVAGFTTNGVLMTKKKQKRILDSGLEYLRISIDDDGLGDAADKLHSASIKVMERSEELVRLRGDAQEPEILWNVVASTYSAPSIPGLITKAAAVGIDGVNIINLVPRFSNLAPLPEDRRVALFQEWHTMGQKKGVRIQSTFGDRFGLARFFYGGGHECPQLLNYAYVTMDGKISPCCHLPRVIFGDLREQTLDKIWHGEKFRRFRKQYRTMPTCKDCRLLLWK